MPKRPESSRSKNRPLGELEVSTMERHIELFCILCGLLFVLFFGAGWLEAGLVPPLSAADGPARTAEFYLAHVDELRLGMLLAQIGAGCAIPFVVVLSQHIDRYIPGSAILAKIQSMAGTLLLVGLFIPIVAIATATILPGHSPELVLGLNDFAFTMILWAFVPATVEALAIGCAVLKDHSSSPVIPRWIGYFNLSVGAIYVLGAPTLYVTHGAFGWDGVLTFWMVFVAFALWVVVSSWMMLGAIKKQP
jgi:hypothetical protein